MKTILAGILAVSSVVAQPTGDWGRAAMMNGGMGGSYGGHIFGSILFALFGIGVTLIVWLWAFKLWKEVRHMK